MNGPAPLVVPILATPFGVVPLPDAAAQNDALAALFAARMQADPHGGAPKSANPLYYRGRDDLLEWPDDPVRRLAQEIFRGVYAVVSAVNELNADTLRTFKLEARGWFSVVQPDGCIAGTSYPLTSWCVVYCVAAPPPSTTRADSGLLRLYESRLGAMFPDATSAAMRMPYAACHYGWRPVPGQMAMFPASLTHEIAMLRATSPLILVTLRVRFVAPGQTGVGRW
jgi:hypothetical protein